MQTFTPGPGSERAFRDALGRFATGVTVVTAAGPAGPMAITANSFTSVSLDPPLVLWCPAKRSSRFDVFCQAPEFVVHVLASDQLSVARHFARTAHDFSPMDWQATPGGLPLLTHFAARFTCRHAGLHEAGDHAIVLGHVIEAVVGRGEPLVFCQGVYGRFLQELET